MTNEPETHPYTALETPEYWAHVESLQSMIAVHCYVLDAR